MRKRKRKKTFDAYFKSISMDIFKGMHGRTMYSFYFSPEFPENPYSSVSSKERKRRREVLFGLEEEAMAAMIDARTGLIPFDIRHRIARAAETGEPVYRSGHIELAIMEINWHCTNNILKNLFMAWLKKNRPKSVKQSVQGRGVPTTGMKWTHLKDLGVWRLMNVMDYADAAALTEEELGKALYKEESEWNESKKRACEMLEGCTEWEKRRSSSTPPPPNS